MRVILREDVPALGKTGDLVKVADGYARNYLLPRKLAAAADAAGIRHVEHVRRLALEHRNRLLKESGDLRDRLGALELTLTKPAGEGDKLFGSVTPRDVEDALVAQGIQADRKRIHIDEPIRTLGTYTVRVDLPGGGTAPLKVAVVRK